MYQLLPFQYLSLATNFGYFAHFDSYVANRTGTGVPEISLLTFWRGEFATFTLRDTNSSSFLLEFHINAYHVSPWGSDERVARDFLYFPTKWWGIDSEPQNLQNQRLDATLILILFSFRFRPVPFCKLQNPDRFWRQRWGSAIGQAAMTTPWPQAWWGGGLWPSKRLVGMRPKTTILQKIKTYSLKNDDWKLEDIYFLLK